VESYPHDVSLDMLHCTSHDHFPLLFFIIRITFSQLPLLSVDKLHGERMSQFDSLTATASDLQAQLTSGKYTSVQLVELYLNQIAQDNGYLHAVIATAPKDDILRQAEKLDEERKSGKIRSSLHGIPILVKDNVATHPNLGMDTTAGSFALVGSKPKKHAPIVDRLLDAGLLIIGKANLSEMSYYKGDKILCGWSAVGGQCQPAYMTGGIQEDDSFAGHCNPGGSSAGSAVAVSAGLAPLSIGTETQGSLIMPGGRAALYTIKPTIGLVSAEGIVPVSALCDSAGPMTKSVLDEANLLDVIVDPSKTKVPKGGYASVMTDSWADIRVGVLDPTKWKFPDEAVKPHEGATKQMVRLILDTFECHL
jgi:amidase